ncbi:unnamed protein product [Caenorhabditis nigoni]
MDVHVGIIWKMVATLPWPALCSIGYASEHAATCYQVFLYLHFFTGITTVSLFIYRMKVATKHVENAPLRKIVYILRNLFLAFSALALILLMFTYSDLKRQKEYKMKVERKFGTLPEYMWCDNCIFMQFDSMLLLMSYILGYCALVLAFLTGGTAALKTIRLPAQLMPIRILSLPAKDLQYAINLMDVSDLIAFSLCSNRTKNLVLSLKQRKIEPISAKIDGSIIQLGMYVFNLQRDYKKFKFLLHEDCSAGPHPDYGTGIWRKQGFTLSDWIAHFQILSNSSIFKLKIRNIPSVAYLDTVKQLIPKCYIIRIGDNCSTELIKTAICKLAPIAEKVEIDKNQNHDENRISEILSLNLKHLHLVDWQKPFELESTDLLAANAITLIISTTKITEKELNRFLKLWMKGSQRFYPPKYMKLVLRNRINREEILKGIKYHTGNHDRLKREDGKELLVSIGRNSLVFDFRR